MQSETSRKTVCFNEKAELILMKPNKRFKRFNGYFKIRKKWEEKNRLSKIEDAGFRGNRNFLKRRKLMQS